MMKPKETAVPCYHCGLDSDPAYNSDLDGEQRAFCCVGCQAVAQAISAGGLADFYQYRDAQNIKPEEGIERFDAYDLPAVQAAFVTSADDGLKSVQLLVGGITCAACAWLIEHYLENLEGLEKVRVNVATHRCSFQWRENEISLSKVFAALHSIGYRPQPGTEAAGQAHRKAEKRNALLRMGIAGLGMMQVGMVAVALHAGAIQGIDQSTQHFLRWVSLIFAIPVILYSAQPFYISAYRALKMRHLNMDVPVSLALTLAFIASVLATYTNTGEVYFDSVSMFTFFLLVGRFLEMRARHTSVSETESLSQLLPVSVERYTSSNSEELELVPISYLSSGDVIRVAAGEVIPSDGQLLSSLASADESLLTGESDLVAKQEGDLVYAGALLAEPSIKMSVSATGSNTRLAAVQALLDQAISNKPKQQQMADKVARYFVASVLLCFIAVFCFWYWQDPSKAFWIALSVLVVTCPCALSLATPAALAAGLNKLRRLGMLIVSPSAIETLPKITQIAIDKTGTLTYGQPSLQKVSLIDQSVSSAFCVDCVAALEKYSRHPIAYAFRDYKTTFSATEVRVVPGKGIAGRINEDEFRFGLASFAQANYQGSYPADGNWQLLSRNQRELAWFLFADEAREDLEKHLLLLKRFIPKVSLLSGDRQKNVDAFVTATELEHCFERAMGDMLPEDKLAYVQSLQARGEKVLMIGDGINDVPVLAVSDLSVAMGSASQLAKVNADAVMLGQNLANLLDARQCAEQTNRVIKQNFAWALGYNIVALPAAAMGFIPPYLAALGMSLSSLIVVLNSLRVNRT